MLVFVLVLLVLTCWRASAAKRNEFQADYCSPKDTNTINAVFSVLIFLSHAVTYVKLDGALNEPYFAFRSFLGQLVVVTYLFFSGFGIMESIKKKGVDYVKKMPKNRFLKLWYHFAIVILLYTAVSVGIIGKSYSLSRWLLSFTGLRSIGNSNWYLFVTFVLYIIVIISFLVFKKSQKIALISVCVLSVGFVIFEKEMGFGSRYYNTLLCFPFGMLFSVIKPKAEKLLMKNDTTWSIGFLASIILFVAFSFLRSKILVGYVLCTFFALTVIVIFMMKIRLGNPVLDWFGKHIFSFFILQRIPMILLKHYGFNKNGYLFIIVSFFATILLSVLFDAFTDKLDSIIFNKKKILKQ